MLPPSLRVWPTITCLPQADHSAVDRIVVAAAIVHAAKVATSESAKAKPVTHGATAAHAPWLASSSAIEPVAGLFPAGSALSKALLNTSVNLLAAQTAHSTYISDQ